jgi:hypothetical protein
MRLVKTNLTWPPLLPHIAIEYKLSPLGDELSTAELKKLGRKVECHPGGCQ